MQEQSNKQFYISDWHYGHANVIAFDNRPFKSLLEMDEALVDRWNAVVSPGDIVYVLGDMFWCKAQDAIPILRSLKGQKFLIKGVQPRGRAARLRPAGMDAPRRPSLPRQHGF